MTRKFDCIGPLVRAGIDYDDAQALRRISMTLHRWHELQCGDSNDRYSWAIERDAVTDRPYVVKHAHTGPYQATRFAVPDRETEAKKRLAKIMARYPELRAYIQGDPRGAALYILRPGDVPEGEDAGSYYTRGLVVC